MGLDQAYDPYGLRGNLSPGLNAGIDARTRAYNSRDFPRAYLGETVGGAVDDFGDTLSGIMPTLSRAALYPFTGGGPEKPRPPAVSKPTNPAAQAKHQAAVSGSGDGQNPAAQAKAVPTRRPPVFSDTQPTEDPWLSPNMRLRGLGSDDAPADSWAQMEGDARGRAYLEAKYGGEKARIDREAADRGDPMQKKIQAAAQDAAYERLQPIEESADGPAIVQDKNGTYKSARPFPPRRFGQYLDVESNDKRENMRERQQILAGLGKAGAAVDAARASGDPKALAAAEDIYKRIEQQAVIALSAGAGRPIMPSPGNQIDLSGITAPAR